MAWHTSTNTHPSAPISLSSTGEMSEAPPHSGLDFEHPPVWSEEKEKILLGPYEYLFSYPGKDIRKELIAAFNVWLQVPDDALDTIANVVAMLHTASLLVDDVEDNSILRRGVPVAHSIFGVAQTINSANYVYFQALNQISKLKNPECLRIYTGKVPMALSGMVPGAQHVLTGYALEELLNLHRGQGMDLFWRDNLRCPTSEDYLEMVSNKTGGLFRLAVKLMQASSASDQDYVPLVNYIGLLFQIRDDYMNLHSSQYHDNKGFCEDLTEGKFSFPIIHSIRKDPTNLQLLNILKQRTEQEDVKKYAVTYMDKKTDSFTYTRTVLAELDVEARELVAAHGGNPVLLKILDKMRVDGR